MTAKILRTNGIIEEAKPKNGKTFSYDELSAIVGGYIEIVQPKGRVNSLLVLNEEGKLIGLPFNRAATDILKQSGGIPGDVIVGDCLLCLANQIE